ncbi:MAG: efflux RND transporter permease subunit [Terriglobia bacterium]
MTISEICVKRPVFAGMLIAFLVVLGVFSFRDLGVDLFPRADFPSVNVQVRLPGASPEEVLTQVILPLENAMSVISGIDEMNSNAQDGGGRVGMRFVLERNLEDAAQDVREKVARAQRDFPQNVETPIVQKADPDSDPILEFVVGGTGSLRETTEIADKVIRPAVETVDGVGEVLLQGGRLRQIRIFLDAEKLIAYGITVNQFRAALQAENVEVPGGDIVRGDTRFGVRTLGRLEGSEQFNDVVISNVRGTPIRVRDLGRVEDSYAEPANWFAMIRKDGNVRETFGVQIRRQAGTNTVQVAETVKQRLDQLKRTLPPGIQIQIIRDQSTYIRASVEALEEHLLLGSIFAGIVVLLFLRDWRSVLVAWLAIPTSIVATFTLLRFMDFTLNNMTLLALTLSVGIVIDDAIVVMENIVRWVEEKGEEPKRAAIDATREITLPVMATTLSLVIIFVPIAFITGFARRYVHEFGWTMAFAVMVSMLVSFTLTPMLASKILRRRSFDAEGGKAGGHKIHGTKDIAFFRFLDRNYGRMLEWSLNHRWVIVLVALGVMASTVPLNRMVGRDFVPADDQNYVDAQFDTPVDFSVEGSAQVVTDLAKRIVEIPEVEFVAPRVERATHSHVYIGLVDVAQRQRSYEEIGNEIRDRFFGLYPNVQAKINPPSGVGGGGEFFGAVRATILGPDFLPTVRYGQEAVGRMNKSTGLVDVGTNATLNSPELQVRVDRQRASDLGVRAQDVGTAVRLMIAGTDQISTYKEGNDQYTVTMQLLPEQQRDVAVLGRLMVPSAKLGQVRLDNLATLERGGGPMQIQRSNRQYQVQISANPTPGTPMSAGINAMRREINAMNLPIGYGYRFGGTARALEETTENLIVAFLLAAIFMYMVLAAQFESFLHPFTIMLALPLSIPFALLTILLTGRTLNLWSALGMFLLLGIVKKNGILQVDYTNRLREQGVPLREAILQANHVRLRPILMTTSSIVAGLIPTAIGIGAGSGQRSAIAMTIIGGQMLCLVLTLLVTPVAYSYFAELEEKHLLRQLQSGFARVRMGVARVFTL